MAKGNRDPIWHHYIPQTYLKHFCDSGGTLLVHAKNPEFVPKRLRPNATGAAKDFYTWQRSSGEKERRAFEEIFSAFAEKPWNQLVRKMDQGYAMDDNDLVSLSSFICLQHARVPAIRDGVEERLAGRIVEQLRAKHAAGELPPLPRGLSIEEVVASVDPSTSLETLEEGIEFARLAMNRVTFRILRNETALEFVTSDNPVVWFDPSTLSSPNFSPYVLSPNGPTVFIFPVNPRICLVGSSSEEGFGWDQIVTSDEAYVGRLNDMVIRFAHRWVYSNQYDASSLVTLHGDRSPVVREKTFIDGRGNSRRVWQWTFGPIKPKKK